MKKVCYMVSALFLALAMIELWIGSIEYAILNAVFADMSSRDCDYWRDKQ